MKLNTSALASASLLSLPYLASAQITTPSLTETVVTANRIEQDPEDVGPNVTILDPGELEKRGLFDLEQALSLVPGALVSSEGGPRGSVSALRFRGTESDHRLVRVDGVRISDSNVLPGNIIGVDSLGGVGKLAILRGPQSTLYGNGAIGGVVDLETGYGTTGNQGSLTLEAGSFSTFRSSAQYSGSLGQTRYFLGFGNEYTANELEFNDFKQRQGALRLETDLNDQTTLGTTLRFWSSEYENPFSLDLLERDAGLVSAYLKRRDSAFWQWDLTFGYFSDALDAKGGFSSQTEIKKSSLEWVNTLTWNDQHQSVLGILGEHTDFYYDAGNVDETQWSGALFANHIYTPVEDLTLTAGLRTEYSEAWNESITWRVSGNYLLPDRTFRLHASAGTGFRAPAYGELYGQPGFGAIGNPDLEPETSFGWDAGIEWAPRKDFRIDLTYFENYIDNLITGFSPPVNLDEATTWGVELASSGTIINEKTNWRLSGTWLIKAEDDRTGERLIRRPRWSAAFDINTRALDKLLLGVGATYGGSRSDTDFTSYPFSTVTLDDHFVARVYASYEILENITLTGRIENAFDTDYETALGFPARGFGAFGGVRFDF